MPVIESAVLLQLIQGAPVAISMIETLITKIKGKNVGIAELREMLDDVLFTLKTLQSISPDNLQFTEWITEAQKLQTELNSGVTATLIDSISALVGSVGNNYTEELNAEFTKYTKGFEESIADARKHLKEKENNNV